MHGERIATLNDWKASSKEQWFLISVVLTAKQSRVECVDIFSDEAKLEAFLAKHPDREVVSIERYRKQRDAKRK